MTVCVCVSKVKIYLLGPIVCRCLALPDTRNRVAGCMYPASGMRQSIGWQAQMVLTQGPAHFFRGIQAHQIDPICLSCASPSFGLQNMSGSTQMGRDQEPKQTVFAGDPWPPIQPCCGLHTRFSFLKPGLFSLVRQPQSIVSFNMSNRHLCPWTAYGHCTEAGLIYHFGRRTAFWESPSDRKRPQPEHRTCGGCSESPTGTPLCFWRAKRKAKTHYKHTTWTWLLGEHVDEKQNYWLAGWLVGWLAGWWLAGAQKSHLPPPSFSFAGWF